MLPILCEQDYFFLKLNKNVLLSETKYLEVYISILSREIIGFIWFFLVVWDAHPFPFFYSRLMILMEQRTAKSNLHWQN